MNLLGSLMKSNVKSHRSCQLNLEETIRQEKKCHVDLMGRQKADHERRSTLRKKANATIPTIKNSTMAINDTMTMTSVYSSEHQRLPFLIATPNAPHPVPPINSKEGTSLRGMMRITSPPE